MSSSVLGSAGKLVILTGMSGAGKTTGLRTFEDLGYYCIDNLPPTLIGTFLTLYAQSGPSVRGIAIVCDVRSGELFRDFREAVEALAGQGYAPELLFFDCEEDVLISRFNEAKRLPPLGAGMRIEEALALERAVLTPLRDLATQVVDTTGLRSSQLQERLLGLYSQISAQSSVSITVLSFGFKHGLPMDADFVFDTRFLPNPFYEENLREKSGNDIEVSEFVLANQLAREYLDSVFNLLLKTLPHYEDVHKHYAVVAMGCTGGRHRSVVLVNALVDMLRESGARCVAQHRDLDRS